jgi:type II secretory pathway component PulF
MHAMLNAGTSVGQALKTLSQHGANRSLRRAAAEMGEAASCGRPWGETMRAYPALFDPLSIGMIVAGENGGFLDRSCMRLAEYAERDYDLQQTIKRETWYPKLLVVCSILIPSAVPFVIALMKGGNPLLAWFQQVWLPLTVLAVVCLAWKAWNRFMPAATHSGPLRIAFDWIKLHVPIVAKISRGLAAAKFCRALGALYASGMGINRMVEIAAGTAGNASFSAAVRRAAPDLERGQGLTDTMRETGQFPGIALQMMHTGEISGNIDSQLDKVADFLEQDAETALKQAVKVLGIVIYLMVAIYIGSQVIGQYTSQFTAEMDAGQQMIDNP